VGDPVVVNQPTTVDKVVVGDPVVVNQPTTVVEEPVLKNAWTSGRIQKTLNISIPVEEKPYDPPNPPPEIVSTPAHRGTPSRQVGSVLRPGIIKNGLHRGVVNTGGGIQNDASAFTHPKRHRSNSSVSNGPPASISDRSPRASENDAPPPPRFDLLCRFPKTPNHLCRDRCTRSHSLQEWKPRICHRSRDCTRPNCGFYHPGKDSREDFLRRLCASPESRFYHSYAKDFLRLYLSEGGGEPKAKGRQTR